MRPAPSSGASQGTAIAARPALILADEPTGELDTATGRQILGLFHHISESEGTTVLIATHDLAVDAFADAVYQLEDGRIADSFSISRQ